jgi:hypothetical protein
VTLEEQLFFVECFFPDAWEYLHDIAGVRLPKYDDNDEIVSWGVPKDTPQEVKTKEDK